MNYVVQPGDNLYAIATRFGVSLDELVRANRLSPPYFIYVGQTLYIPVRGPVPRPEEVNRRLDRLERRVDRLDNRVDDLTRRVDRLERPRPPRPTPPRTTPPRTT